LGVTCHPLTDGTGLVHTPPPLSEDDLNVSPTNYQIRRGSIPVDGEMERFTSLVPNIRGRPAAGVKTPIKADQRSQIKGAIYRHEDFGANIHWVGGVRSSSLILKRYRRGIVKIGTAKADLVEINKKNALLMSNSMGDDLEMVGECADWNQYQSQSLWGRRFDLAFVRLVFQYTCVEFSDELESLSARQPIFINIGDSITFPCPKCYQMMKRIRQVLWCWFESGS